MVKSELSSIELHYLVEELQFLEGSKLVTAYQPEKEELLLVFHQTDHGKAMLRVIPGKWIFLTKTKPENPANPHGYCLYLRKHLKHARVVAIQQVDSERIVDIHFETREAKFHFFIELFGKGNAILTDVAGTILSPLQTQVWKDRAIRAREHYTYPPIKHNVLIIAKPSFDALLRSTQQLSLVKALAVDLGLGGIYAEELCFRAGLDKAVSPVALSESQCSALYGALEALRSAPCQPGIVKKAEEVIDIVPFPLRQYAALEFVGASSYHEAFDAVLSTTTSRHEDAMHQERQSKEQKTQKIIDMQTKQLALLEKEAMERQRKGELVYENYQVASRLLEELRTAKQQYSWEDLRTVLQGHKLVKEVDAKRKKIVVEL